jgi:peptide deformylase
MDVVKYPADILRVSCRDITEFSKELEEFSQGMIHSMLNENGIGLAGPQVGMDWNIFIVGIPDEKPLTFINPTIVQTSIETNPYEEGCLSIPGVYADVIRPSALTIQAYNPKGKPFRMDAEGMLARVIQHEMDHLKGVLFIDYLSKPKRERLMKEYKKRMRA